MKNICLTLMLTCLICSSCHRDHSLRYLDPQAPIQERVEDLLSRMTIDEKVGQLLCPLGWFMYQKDSLGQVSLSPEFIAQMQKRPLGGCWGVMRADPWTQKTLETGLNPRLAPELINLMQHYAVDSTRLGIPLLLTEEAAHGHMAIGTTVFPTALGQAATFDDSLLFRMGEAIALEVRSQGAHVGYGPVLDLARDPRWGRMEETFGEDPYLTGCLGTSMVRGMQGQHPDDGRHLYATLKHFAAYGVPMAGINGAQTDLGWRALLYEYTPQFRRAVHAGVKGIMTSYNCIDGIPCTANPRLLTDLLRHQWGFQGVVYSDLVSIEVMANTHRLFPDYKTAAVAALQAGVDIDLQGNAFGPNLANALEVGLISKADLDRAVSNVLRLKFEMGLFEHPYVDVEKSQQVVRSPEHRQLALQVAREGIVLLKNDGLLPLSPDLQRIAVIGPNADVPYNQLGDYTAPQERTELTTVLDGVRQLLPKAQISYFRGCAIRDTRHSDIQAAVAEARKAQATILVIGGSSARDFRTSYAETGAAIASTEEEQGISDMETGEGMDRASLSLMGHQQQLLQALIDAHVPLVVVYIQGRTLDMNLAAQSANALLTAWYPGEQGGRAIAEVLFGQYNPAGRLPVSIPRSVGQVPIYYSRPSFHDYADSPESPLFPFGFGLSYTTFAYSDIQISTPECTLQQLQEQGIDVSFALTNTGPKEGDEVPQLYVTDEVSSVRTAPIALKGFRRVHLDAGQSTTVTFHLSTEDLSLFNAELQEVVEPGSFRIQIGPSSNQPTLCSTLQILP